MEPWREEGIHSWHSIRVSPTAVISTANSVVDSRRNVVAIAFLLFFFGGGGIREISQPDDLATHG